MKVDGKDDRQKEKKFSMRNFEYLRVWMSSCKKVQDSWELIVKFSEFEVLQNKNTEMLNEVTSPDAPLKNVIRPDDGRWFEFDFVYNFFVSFKYS